MMTDERALIEQAATGDAEAFTELVRRYQDRIFGLVMRMTSNRDAALDLTQETFLAVWQNLPGFRQEASFSTWLIQIALNKTRNYMKRAARETALPADFDQASPVADPEAELASKTRRERLTAAINDLPPVQKAVFHLRFYDHLPFDDIARIQKSSVSAAKTSFAEAVKKLRSRLTEQ
ncbi:MAG: sigma-70 family RNA polymerase sigma factor [candidate division Zixibacteria bacterium]|nr:sigma-70 family RNA polymerase sigma factor [candidate division Zixibacteria bacterium]